MVKNGGYLLEGEAIYVLCVGKGDKCLLLTSSSTSGLVLLFRKDV
jgi:hypothetical protein